MFTKKEEAIEEEEYRIDLPADLPSGSRQFYEHALNLQFTYSIIGLAAGVIIVLFGIVLFLKGITGNTTWVAKVLDFESKITDAAPGALLFFSGIAIVFITRFDVKIVKNRIAKRKKKKNVPVTK